MTDPRRQSSHHSAWSISNIPRRRRLWTVHLWTFTWRRHLKKKTNKKSFIICTVTKDVDTSRLNSYICPHSYTPLASKAYIPQRCGRDYIKETGIFFQHSAARRGNGAKPEGTSLLWRHDNTANALFSFWRRHISRWRRRWYRQTGEGEALSSDYSFFLSMSALAQVHVVIMYTHRTTVLLWCSGLCGIRVNFLYDAC